jgi:hypothetical protein
MKRMLTMAAVLFGLASMGVNCPAVAADDPKAPYVHSVIFYLKKDAPKDEGKALIADAHELLAKIPTVRMIKIGPPAEKSTPEVAKMDYQIGLLVLFDNYDGLKTYLDHPLHVKYVENHMKHIEKVLVYDFENAKK